MKRIIILLIVMSMGLTLAAQETIDLLTLTGRYGLPSDYEDTYSEKATE